MSKTVVFKVVTLAALGAALAGCGQSAPAPSGHDSPGAASAPKVQTLPSTAK